MAAPSDPSKSDHTEITTYYDSSDEAGRLGKGTGPLEFIRSQEIITRYLPPAPGVILDVGGGPGTYACWLAALGYEVHLVDMVPRHLEQARTASQRQADHPIASIRLGDARDLAAKDGCADAVLLLGPLYHLAERGDRLRALREAWRVLRPGGWIFAAAIARPIEMLKGLFTGLLEDPEFARVATEALSDGKLRNPKRHTRCFTTAYMHQPEDLGPELTGAGFLCEAVLSVEGVGWLLPNLEQLWQDPSRRRRVLDAVRLLEDVPSLMGASIHLMAVGRKDRTAPPGP